jgi:hypothetical protein
MLGLHPKFGSHLYISVEEITMGIVATIMAVTTVFMAIAFSLFMVKELFKSH